MPPASRSHTLAASHIKAWCAHANKGDRMQLRKMLRLLVPLAVLGGILVASPLPASASPCQVTYGGQSMYRVCEYGITTVQWPDGHFQYFIVSDSNYGVYDTYQYGPYSSGYSAWRNLGGVARSGVSVDNLSSTSIQIRVAGT